jgi:putative chitinase
VNRAAFFAACRVAPFGGRLTQAQVEGTSGILDAWDHRGATDPRWLAYTLATAFHETGRRMQSVREGFAASDAAARKVVAAREYGKPDPVTGEVYYGRGLVQLTWAENYKRVGNRLGIDLYHHPDLALDDATWILVNGMIEGLYSGKMLEDYFNDTIDDPVRARKIVNGQDKAEPIAGYHAQFLAAVEAA